MEKIIRGRAWRFGDNIDTDQIYPGQHMSIADPEEMAAHAMEGAGHPKFRKEVKPGDVIVAGHNFGSGSSREQAPVSLKYVGVCAVVAESFARIFFRNGFNVGLPVVEAPGVSTIDEGDDIEINLETGEIKNLTKGETYRGNPIPPFLLEILDKGGLIAELEDKFLG